MTVFTDADDLYECVDLSDKTKPKVSQGVKTHIRAAAPAREIILLGQTVDEAIANVDKFLDDAVLSGSYGGTCRSRQRHGGAQKRSAQIFRHASCNRQFQTRKLRRRRKRRHDCDVEIGYDILF